MMKFLIVALLAVFAVVNARGIIGEDNNLKNNELVPLEKESRVLLEVPLIGTLIFKGFKVVWFLLSTFCTLLDYKLVALALAVNIGYYSASYLFNNCYPLIVGAVLMFGFCKLTGLCSHSYSFDKVDPLSYAVNNLHLGALKYGDNI